MGGLVGAMLHPHPRHALVIGLGTGSTAGWLAAVPGMERVDVVELEPAVVRVAKDCAPVNRDVLDRDNVRLILGDGREYLLTTDQHYDVIFSEPSNPYRAGISSLFTREFYQAAEQRLNEGGLFLQWLQGYETDPAVVRTAYATLASVFPAIESWQTQGSDLLLVSGREPLVHDWQRVARRAAEEPYRMALERVWGVSGAAGFYSGFLAGPELARSIAAAVERGREPINTDDHPVIEYGFVRNLGRSGLFSVEDLASLSRRLGCDRPRFGRVAGAETELGAPDWAAVQDAASARAVFLDFAPGVPPGADNGLRARIQARQLYRQGKLVQAEAAWETQTATPRHPADLLLVADGLAASGDDRASAAVDRLAEVLPTEALAIRAQISSQRGDWRATTSTLEEFFARLHRSPWLASGVQGRVYQLTVQAGRHGRDLARRLFAATSTPFLVGVGELPRQITRVGLAEEAGFWDHCVDAFADMEPFVPWRGHLLERRLQCYQKNASPLLERARDELAEWESAEPPPLDAGIQPDR